MAELGKLLQHRARTLVNEREIAGDFSFAHNLTELAGNHGYVYVNYIRIHTRDYTVYSGRTGGPIYHGEAVGTAAIRAIEERYSSDNRPAHTPGLPVNVAVELGSTTRDRSSNAYAAHKGGEQYLIDHWGGAQSDVRNGVAGTSDNAIRAIGPDNVEYEHFLQAARTRGWALPDRHGQSLRWRGSISVP